MAVHLLNVLYSLTGLRSILITLVHSLWLGAIMALLAGVIIVLTNRSGPLLRYRLLTGLLILFAVSIGYIFCSSITGNTTTGTGGSDNIISGQAQMQQTQNTHQQETFFTTLVYFIGTYARTIVFIWFIVICFKCARLVSGLRELHGLKKTNVLEAGEYWIGRMNELAEEIGIVKKIGLLQSVLAKVPMVIGHLKPIILFPVGILNALQPDEVEAILLHELAHIRRNDFLINLLQQFAEIFFFFNPGVLWVSSLIKNERENCCDDIAISITNDKKKFIHALVAFQEYNEGAFYATAFPGSKNHLLNRVKRIITNNNKTLSNMEKLLLASGIIITSLVALAFSPGHTEVKKEAIKTAQRVLITRDTDDTTVKESKSNNTSDARSLKYSSKKNALSRKEVAGDTTTKTHYSGVIEGKKIELTEENNRLKELYIDGKKIPEDQYSKYSTIIDKVHQDMKEDREKLEIDEMNADELKQKGEGIKEQMEAMKEVEEVNRQNSLMQQDLAKQNELLKQEQVEMKKELQGVTKKNEEIMKAQSLKMQADLIKQQKLLKLKQAEFQKGDQKMRSRQEKLNRMMEDSIRAKRTTSVLPVRPGVEIPVKPEAIAKLKVMGTPEVSVRFRSLTSVKPAIRLVPVALAGDISPIGVAPVAVAIPPLPGKPVVNTTSNSTTGEIIRGLEKLNIINTKDNLSFRLTNNELIVNGVKQPDAIHQDILKYIKKPGGTFSLSYSNQDR